MKTLLKTILVILITIGAIAAITIKSVDTTPTGVLITFRFNGQGYYIERQTKVEVTNILYESTNDFYLEPNEIGIEFNNGSWAIANEQTDTYIFQAIELGDWEQQFNNLNDFENCIKTYTSIKNTGSY